MLLCDPFQGGTDGWKDPQSYRARALLHRRELGARGFAETAPGKKDLPVIGEARKWET
jgi:hypothetical protein